MEQKTFQIMYNALVEIASANAFFPREKKLVVIAKNALLKIGQVSEQKSQEDE